MSMVRAPAVFGVAGIASGFLTPHLSEALRVILPDWVIIDVPISMWLAGIAFGAALAGALAYCLRYQPRQWLIIPVVLAGWSCAVQVCLWSGAGEPKSYSQLSGSSAPADRCQQLDGAGTSAADVSKSQCFELFSAQASDDAAAPNRYWRSLSAYLVAGAIGALITAFGVPLATRHPLSRRSYAVITLTGALVAAAWFVLAGAIAFLGADQHWYALFAPWQAAVAAVIGRSLRT